MSCMNLIKNQFITPSPSPLFSLKNILSLRQLFVSNDRDNVYRHPVVEWQQPQRINGNGRLIGSNTQV
ncbi:unnamed protein product [Meloidogyne enterolobii]|uniref:Uncharacterized protein n=1 Tax=Meloidogyne enterolobii TaxID=390850 RepID=A0ACB0XYX4_MELEN